MYISRNIWVITDYFWFLRVAFFLYIYIYISITIKDILGKEKKLNLYKEQEVRCSKEENK